MHAVRLLVAAGILLGTLLAGSVAEAAEAYTVVDLGTLGGSFGEARGINSSGQVVGYATTADGLARAFIWDAANGMRDLGTVPGGLQAFAHGINDAGQVIGQADAPGMLGFSAVRWDAISGVQLLGTLGGSFSIAQGINNSGQVVGISYTQGETSDPHATLWLARGPSGNVVTSSSR